MRYAVEVTREDIDDGERDSPFSCPVALAILRALGVRDGYGFIDVDAAQIGLRVDRGWAVNGRPLPARVSQFIHDFDTGLPVEPVAFGFVTTAFDAEDKR